MQLNKEKEWREQLKNNLKGKHKATNKKYSIRVRKPPSKIKKCYNEHSLMTSNARGVRRAHIGKVLTENRAKK